MEHVLQTTMTNVVINNITPSKDDLDCYLDIVLGRNVVSITAKGYPASVFARFLNKPVDIQALYEIRVWTNQKTGARETKLQFNDVAVQLNREAILAQYAELQAEAKAAKPSNGG